MARLCTQAWVRSRSDTDSDQPSNDEDDGDDSDDSDEDDDNDVNDDDDHNNDDDGKDDNDNDDVGAPVLWMPAAVPDSPKDAVPPPASVLFAAPVAPPKCPKPSSRRSTRLEQLRIVADSNTRLPELLSIIGHDVTERLLERINDRMNSVAFFRRLIKLSRERLDRETRNTLDKEYGYM